jgi:hypothetical protein
VVSVMLWTLYLWEKLSGTNLMSSRAGLKTKKDIEFFWDADTLHG